MATNSYRFMQLSSERSRKRPLYAPVLFMTSLTVASIVACEWALNSTAVSLPCGICIGLLAFPIADEREEQGIKTLNDVSACEVFISELVLEKTS